MKPELNKAATAAVVTAAIALLVMYIAESWIVAAAAAAVSLVSVVVIVRGAKPISVAPPWATSEHVPRGSVVLLDGDGVSHETLSYHQVAAFRVASVDGHVVTCSPLPAILYPLRKVELRLDGEELALQRRGARRIDVRTLSGEPVLVLERTRLKDRRAAVKATTAAGELVREAAVDEWWAPGYRSRGAPAAIAQATVLAGIAEQLQSLPRRMLMSVG